MRTGFHLSGVGLPGCPEREAVKWVFVFFSPGLVVMKLNIRQQKQTTKEQSGLSLKTKTNEKLNVNINQQSIVRTAHVCVHTTAQLQYTIQHRTVLTMFSHLPSQS